MAEKPRFWRRTVFAKNLGFGVGFGYRNNTNKNIAGRFFELVTKHACDTHTDRYGFGGLVFFWNTVYVTHFHSLVFTFTLSGRIVHGVGEVSSRRNVS